MGTFIISNIKINNYNKFKGYNEKIKNYNNRGGYYEGRAEKQ